MIKFYLSAHFASEKYQQYPHRDRHKEQDTFYPSMLGLQCKSPSLDRME